MLSKHPRNIIKKYCVKKEDLQNICNRIISFLSSHFKINIIYNFRINLSHDLKYLSK